MSLRMIFILFATLLQNLTLDARSYAVATQACPAYNDLKHRRNSQEIYLHPGQSYEILQNHKGQVLVKIPSSPPVQRWVDPFCLSEKRDPLSSSFSSRSTQQQNTLHSLLVLSWHNSFCKTHPHRKECRPLFNHAKNHLTLHGLWPQPPSLTYCHIPPYLRQLDRRHRWYALPKPPLSLQTRQELQIYMPGSLSALDRHEWIKHGSCYDPDPQRYFHDALSLTKQVDRSMLGEYLRANEGRKVKLKVLRKIFERSFGKGNGSELALFCKKGDLSELRISILGKGDDLKKLLKKAPPLPSRCLEALVEPYKNK